MDSLGLLKEVYDETAARRNAAIERQQSVQQELNDLRIDLKIAEGQAKEDYDRDEAVIRKQTEVRELYNGSPIKPQALLMKLDALTTEQVETARQRKQARDIVSHYTSAIAQAETRLAVARSNFENVSNEIAQLDGEMQRARRAQIACQ